MSFESLGLSEALLRAVADAGYTTPTPIQLQAIPAVLSGGDLMAGAQTGTGKTAGFVLPILQRLSTTPRPAGPAGKTSVRVLILTPTRELAAQVEESVRTYGKHLKISSTVIFGGVGINPQISALRRGVDIVVATPGRLLDHHGQRTIDLSRVEVLVLDEADRMLDMGFIPDIKRIIATLPKQRQNLLFSATFSDEIRDLAKGMLRSPALVQATPRNSTVESVAQRVHPVDAKRKAELLIHLVKEHQWFQVLVFTRTKHGANKLSLQLEKSGISSQAIHGNKSQNARTKALAEFKDSKLQVLVATDIAARGLDIEQLPHVVNFDLPNVPEDYVHRIGRTGRAGATGEAISLVSPEEMGLLRDIERVTRRPIARSVVTGFEAGSRSSASDHAAQHEPDDSRRAPAPRPRSSASRSSGNGERARRPAGTRAPAAGNHAAGPGSRAPSVGGRPARGDAAARGERAPRAEGAPPPAPRAGGAPTRNGSAPRSNGSAERSNGSASSRRPEIDPSVRANLPPGWSMASSGRRGR